MLPKFRGSKPISFVISTSIPAMPNPGIRKSRVLAELLGFVIPGCHDHSMDINVVGKKATMIPKGTMVLTNWASGIVLKNQSKIKHGVVLVEMKRFDMRKGFIRSETFIEKVTVQDLPIVRSVIEVAMDKRNFAPIAKLIKKKQYEACLVMLKLQGVLHDE